MVNTTKRIHTTSSDLQLPQLVKMDCSMARWAIQVQPLKILLDQAQLTPTTQATHWDWAISKSSKVVYMDLESSIT